MPAACQRLRQIDDGAFGTAEPPYPRGLLVVSQALAVPEEDLQRANRGEIRHTVERCQHAVSFESRLVVRVEPQRLADGGQRRIAIDCGGARRRWTQWRVDRLTACPRLFQCGACVRMSALCECDGPREAEMIRTRVRAGSVESRSCTRGVAHFERDAGAETRTSRVAAHDLHVGQRAFA